MFCYSHVRIRTLNYIHWPRMIMLYGAGNMQPRIHVRPVQKLCTLYNVINDECIHLLRAHMISISIEYTAKCRLLINLYLEFAIGIERSVIRIRLANEQ